MKQLLLILIILTSIRSFAGSAFVEQPSVVLNEEGICQVLALKKAVAFAENNGANYVDVYTFRLVDNDKRFFRPSHYSWYELNAK